MNKKRIKVNTAFWLASETSNEKLLKAILQHLQRTNKVNLLYTTALRQCYLKVALQREVLAIKEVLNLAAKALETCFLFATKRATEAQFRYDGATTTITKNDKFNPANYTEDIDFVKAIYLAMLSDTVAMDKLMVVGVEELTFSRNKTDAFYQDYSNFLKSIVRKDGKAGDWLIRTIKGTFPDQLRYGISAFLEHNTVEHLKVWVALLGKDAAKFNEALALALQRHHDYWNREKSFVRSGLAPIKDEEGNFSLALVAIGKLANQNGMPVEVKSDYLPNFLIA